MEERAYRATDAYRPDAFAAIDGQSQDSSDLPIEEAYAAPESTNASEATQGPSESRSSSGIIGKLEPLKGTYPNSCLVKESGALHPS